MVVNPAVFEADPDSLATQPAGSGPFVLDSYVQNSKAVLHKNDKYFEADGITITNFELYPAADAATVVASLQSGQYNVGLLPGSQLEAAKAAGLEVQVMPSLYVATLDVNNDDEAVRRPQGRGGPALRRRPPGPRRHRRVRARRGRLPAVPRRVRRLQPRARRHLRLRPGQGRQHPQGGGLHRADPADDLDQQPRGRPRAAPGPAVQVGFEPTIETIPQAQFTQQVYINHEKALAVDFFAGRESPAQAFQVLFSDTGLMNPGREYDPAVKEAIEKVIATPLDDPAYADLLQEATKVAVTTMPNTFLYSRPRVVARAKAVSELPEHLTLVTWEGVTVS